MSAFSEEFRINFASTQHDASKQPHKAEREWIASNDPETFSSCGSHVPQHYQVRGSPNGCRPLQALLEDCRFMDLQFDGKAAPITGSSKGIDEAVAKTFAREKARVIIHGRNGQEVMRVVEEIRQQGGQAMMVTGDLTCHQPFQSCSNDAPTDVSGLFGV